MTSFIRSYMTSMAAQVGCACLTIIASLGLSLGYVGNAHAEKADRDKPINILADKMQHDDLKQVTVFTGKVVFTKGSIVVQADRLVLRQDPEGYQYGTAYAAPGKLASFRQKRDLPDQFVEGFGDEIDYDGKAEIVRFKKNAVLKRVEKEKLFDEVCGNLIVYESLTELFTAESGPASACNPSGRIKLFIQPRTETSQSVPAANASVAGAPANGSANGPTNPSRPSLKASERPNSVK